MNSKDSLGDRMKTYEQVFDQKLVGRMPIVLRIDGKAFHTYTRGLKRPWDDALNDVMNRTALTLCESIQGAQFAYVQSDEISILIHGYKTLTSQAYFDGRLQKITSVTASIAASAFTFESWRIFDNPDEHNKVRLIRPAYFDARVFNMPEAEVCNYFLWRQQDATRNSVQSLARSLYSHKECNNRNGAQLQEMCFAKGQNWDSLSTAYKRGRCIVRKAVTGIDGLDPVVRHVWSVDNEIPIFSKDRDYVDKHLAVEKD